MRFKLLRRRLTISAPRMVLRSAMPWPLRWAGAAIVLGFCGAISLWAFELGKDIAGVDTGAKEELLRVREDMARLQVERDRLQSILNTSGSAMVVERAAQDRLSTQVRKLEAENRTLREDLGFFEKLMPANGSESVAIRGLQAEVLAGTQLRWQVLVRDLFTCQRCRLIVTGKGQAVADHVRPHRGNEAMFWNASNIQCICKACHDSIRQAEDKAFG